MIIKVRNGRYRPRTSEPLKFEEFEIECKGSGTKDDPAIIDPSSNFPKGNIDIVESELFIVIKDLDIKLLALRYSKNIVIRNCRFNSLMMADCNHVNIEDSHISFLNWFGNQNCVVKNSVTEESIHIYKCSKNKFINCEFWNLFFVNEKYSRGNKFENCDSSPTYFIPNKNAFEKIKAPALKSISTYSLNGRSSVIEVECTGSGTKENPYVIFNHGLKDQNVRELQLFCKKDWIVFKNLDLKILMVYDTKHVTLEDCKISKSCMLKFCADIKFNYADIKKLKFGACKDTVIANSGIQEIETYKGYILGGSKLKNIDTYQGYGEPITLRNCTYTKIKKKSLPAIKIG